MCTIFFLSSQSSLPVKHMFTMQDKVFHFIAFACLGYGLYRILRFHQHKPIVITLVTIGVCGLYGLSDEIHQSFVPNRVFDWWDLFADVLGVCFACSIGKFLFRKDLELFSFLFKKQIKI